MHAIICTDKPGGLEIRKANRDKHLAYLAETGAALAGPFLDADGNMSGSLVLIPVDTREEAEAWAANDPYAQAGLFTKTRIEAFKKVIG
jgi:uncharacterized protein